jgi:hypothetical protein
MADVLFKFDLPAVNLPTAALQQPWIVNFAKDVFELIYKRFELQPSEIGNDESIFFRYLKLTYIKSKEWAYDTIVDNPYSGISLIKGAFDSDDRRVLHFNTESQRRRYDKFIANKSGRIDGRLFLTKKTNAIGMICLWRNLSVQCDCNSYTS